MTATEDLEKLRIGQHVAMRHPNGILQEVLVSNKTVF